MGFELLTQPQVFTTRLTAVGGIEGYVPPFISKFHTWTITTPTSGTIFDIPQDFVGLTHAADSAYIVNISGTVIPPPNFDIDYNSRELILNNPVPAGTIINLTQIGTIALSTANYAELTGLNFFSINSDIENIISQNITTSNLSTNSLFVSANSESDAVYVTQTGIGNALYVVSNTTPFVFTSAGNIGIGTSSPESKLTVDGTIEGGARLFLDKDIDNLSWIGARGSLVDTRRTAIGFSVFPDSQPLSGTIENILFRTNNSDRVKIDSAGYVGIGTQAPLSKLHIETSGSEKILQTTTDSSSPTIQQNFSTKYVDGISKLDILDPISANYFDDLRSHAIEFRRKVPIRPVNYWLTSSPVLTSIFALNGGPILQTSSQAYIVTVGSVIQPYTSYTVNPTNRRITFNSNINAGTNVYVLQTLNPSLSTAYDSVVTQVVSSNPNDTDVFSLSGLASPLRNVLGQYVVGVNGVYQIPHSDVYTINTSVSTITFDGDVPADLLVSVTRIPSAVSFTGGAEDACFLGTFYTWTTAVSTNVSQLSLAGGPTDLLSDRNSYIVNIGGVIQTPNTYRVSPRDRQLLFGSPVPGSTFNPVDIAITQLAAPEMPIRYSTVLGIGDECITSSIEPINEIVTVRPSGLTVLGSISATRDVFLATDRQDVTFCGPSAINATISAHNVQGASFLGRDPFFGGLHIVNDGACLSLKKVGDEGAVIKFYNLSAASQVGSIFVTTNSTNYNQGSDYRLKTYTIPLTTGLTIIDQVQPCEFTWKSSGSTGRGFIAHELQAVVPEAVTGEKDAVNTDGTPEYQGVDASKLVPYLVSAIKELKDRVEALEAV